MNESIIAQKKLGLYCKNGLHEPTTSIQENTFQYRRLVINVVKNTLSNAYPLTVQLLGENQFDHAAHFFFENHTCQEHQVWKLPYEFYTFYKTSEFPFEHQYPFLSELLLFEWLEIDVFMMKNEVSLPFKPHGDVKQDKFVINPELKIQVLHYPIHEKIAHEITEKDYGNYFISIHRNPVDFQVYFNEISYQHAQILMQLYEEPKTFTELQPVILEIEPDKAKANKYLIEFIEFAFKNQLILGFLKEQ